jgi:hypothetical protein
MVLWCLDGLRREVLMLERKLGKEGIGISVSAIDNKSHHCSTYALQYMVVSQFLKSATN